MKLPEVAVKHPITTTILFITMGVLGIVSLTGIGMELFPDINLPTAAVIAVYPGVGPFEVEADVTKPLEEAVSTVNGVDKVTSSSLEGVSVLVVSFRWGVNMETIVPNIREKISSIEGDLPDGVDRPMIFKYNPDVLPCYSFNVSAAAEGMDIRRLVDRKITPQMERIAGVASCSVSGGKESAVTVKLDLDSIGKKEIPIIQVLQVFQGENVNLPGGNISLKDRYLVLRTIGEFETLEDVGNVLVGHRENVPVYLKDVAEIELSYLPQEVFVHAGGTKGVRVSINKMQGHNTVKVIQDVKAALEEVKTGLPPSVKIAVSSDQSISILQSIGSVTDAAWQGGLLAVLVLLIFLRNWRSTLIVSLSIPISVVATFMLMDFADINLNIMSLAGLTLGVGMFVDNSIVVLEVVFRKLLSGMPPKEAAITGAGEVSLSVAASTLTNVVVFVPILFMTGFASTIMRDLALTISFSMLVSLVSALTLVPVLCTRFLKMAKGARLTPRTLEGENVHLEVSLADVELHTGNRIVDKAAKAIQNILQALDDFYEKALAWALRHAAAVIVTALALLAASVFSIYLLGMEFLPETDEGTFAISLETKVESPYERTEEKVAQIERIIIDYLGKDLQSLSSVVGQGGSMGPLGGTGSHVAQVGVVMVRKDARRRTIWTVMNDLSSAIRSQVTEVKFSIKASGLSSLVSLAGGSESPVVVELAGEDLAASEAFGLRIAELMKSIPGTRNVSVSYQTGKPEIQFHVKRREAVSLGLSPMEIAATIRAAYKGMTVSRYKQDDGTYDVYMLLRDEDRNSLARIGSMFLVNRAGARIPLENVVDVTEATGPVSINRVNKTRMVTVTCALTGEKPLNQVTSDLRKDLKELGPPPSGIRQSITGSSQMMSDTFVSMGLALLLGMGLVYVVMACQFESLLHPFIIMFSIPFSLVGLTVSLLATNTTFNMVAFIGAILLVGYVVNTAIVLVDYVNILRKSGIGLEKAIHIGGRTRLKPVFMSVGTTLLGMLPMALGFGTGSEMWAPLARAIVGGLLSSTVITLVLVPVLYYLVESKLRRKKPA